jgi:hypothetical protein
VEGVECDGVGGRGGVKKCESKHVGKYDMGLMIDDECILSQDKHPWLLHVGSRFTWKSCVHPAAHWQPELTRDEIELALTLLSDS